MTFGVRLVDDWRQAWRWASVRVALLFGAMGAVGTMAWPVLQWVIDSYLPDGVWRAVVAAVVFVVLFGVPLIARITQKAEPPADAGT